MPETPDLYRMGYQLLPLVGKKPAIPWKHLQEVRATESDVREWLQRYENIGVVTGKLSGCVVLDCDSEGAYGWAIQNGYQSKMRTRTPRGMHLWFRYRPMGNSVKVCGREMDIRGDGGYVVVPPSLHPSGILYSWEAGPVPPSQLPEFPLPLVQETKQLTRGRIHNVAAYLARIESKQGQNGSAGLVRAASVCRDAGLSPAQAMVELLTWNRPPNVSPAWDARELARAVDRVFKL